MALLGRPRKVAGRNKGRPTSLWLGDESQAVVEAVARANGISRSEVIRTVFEAIEAGVITFADIQKGLNK